MGFEFGLLINRISQEVEIIAGGEDYREVEYASSRPEVAIAVEEATQPVGNWGQELHAVTPILGTVIHVIKTNLDVPTLSEVNTGFSRGPVFSKICYRRNLLVYRLGFLLR